MTNYTKKDVLLKVEQVSLAYGDKQILRDVNFEIRDIVRTGVQQGQVVSLIGRSGIGKTQLFKILSGLNQPTSGKVKLGNGNLIKAGDMGVVFQNYYLFEWRTIYQSLEMSAKKNPSLKESQIKNEINKYADDFQLTEHLSKYPQQLSGGQRQRVSIIQQLLKGSSFILFDEPFSGLDVIVLEKVVNLIHQVSLSDELKTLIIVSHDIETSLSLSDTVFILANDEGKSGATIKKEIDLCAEGIAWNPDIKHLAAFKEIVAEIKGSI